MQSFASRFYPLLAVLTASAVPAGLVVACIGDDPNVVGGASDDAAADSAIADGAAGDGGSVQDAPSGDAPADVDAAPLTKRIFVTTGVTDGNFPGLKGADDYCQDAANKAGAGGKFISFLSIPGANAIDRLVNDGPWYSMDRKTLLFTGKTTGAHPISGLGPASPLNQNEIGQTFTTPDTRYWTGTQSGGQSSTAHCDQWTNDTTGAGFAGGTTGLTDKTDKNWTAFGDVTCYSPLHVLCFEQ